MEDRMACFSYNTTVLLDEKIHSESVEMGYKKGDVKCARLTFMCDGVSADGRRRAYYDFVGMNCAMRPANSATFWV